MQCTQGVRGYILCIAPEPVFPASLVLPANSHNVLVSHIGNVWCPVP